MDHFLVIIRVLLKHRFKLILMPLLVMGLIYYLTAHTPQKYKTEAQLFLNLQEGKGASLADEDLKQYQVHTYFQNTIELLKSKKNAELVQLKLIEKALNGETVFAKGNESLIANKTTVQQRINELYLSGNFLESKRSPDSIMFSFLNYHQLSTNYLIPLISAFRIMDSNFIKVELTEMSPQRTKVLIDLFIEALVDENRTLSKNKVKGHKDIIEGLVRQAKADLDEKIKRLEKYKVANNIINLGEHTKAIVTYLVQLEGQRATLLTKIQSGYTGKEEVIKTVKQGNELALDLTTQKEILVLKAQLREMNSKMLKASFENQTINIEAINENIESVKSQIQEKLLDLSRKSPYDPSRLQLDLVSKYVGFDLEAEMSKDMVTIVNDEIARVMNYSSRFAPFESTISAYEQEISTAQNVYLLLLNKFNLTQTMEYGSGENVIEIIDPPYLPIKAEASKRVILVAAGGVSMLFIMIGFLIIVQLMDETVNSVEKFEHRSPLRIMAAIPKPQRKGPQQSIELIRQHQLTKVAQVVDGHCTKKGTLILLTSAQAMEGTHGVAAEIQSRLLQREKSIAVIDADWMQSENNEGFISLKPLLENHGVFKNEIAIQKRVDELREQFETVVIICSPLNLTTDIQYWMRQKPFVIHVFKANRLYSKVDKRIEGEWQALGNSFLGVVLIDTEVENMEDYLGEIPRERSSVRRWTKKLLTRNF